MPKFGGRITAMTSEKLPDIENSDPMGIDTQTVWQRHMKDGAY